MYLKMYINDGYIYVYKDNHKLYKMKNNEDSRKLIMLENSISLLDDEMNESPTKFHFKAFNELSEKDKYSLLEIINMLMLKQYVMFDKKAFLFMAIEGLVFNFINENYKDKKDSIINDEAYYKEIFKSHIELLKNELEKLSVEKEELPLSYLNPNMIDINKENLVLLKYFLSEINKIDFELLINTRPLDVLGVGNKLDMIDISVLPNEVEKEKVKNYRFLRNEYVKNYKLELYDKLEYYICKLERNRAFNISQLTMIFYLIFHTLSLNIGCLESKRKIVLIISILLEIHSRNTLTVANEALEGFENKTLSLK